MIINCNFYNNTFVVHFLLSITFLDATFLNTMRRKTDDMDNRKYLRINHR